MIDVEDTPAEVAAAFAVQDTGRSLSYRPDPQPTATEPESEEESDRPWDLRFWNRVRVILELIAIGGVIAYIRRVIIGLLLKELRRLWRFRLWLHSARLYGRFLRSVPVTDEVFAKRMAICERCTDWHLKVKPDDPRCESPKVAPGLYCTACNCPIEERALLKNKNAREGHRCPKGFHPGSEPDPYARQTCNSASCKEKKRS